MKVRIDQRVHELGLAESREKAKRMIMAGQIFVDGLMVNKPGTKVDSGSPVTCRDHKPEFVSRGGHKLQKAVEDYDIDLKDRVCMDIGASTGGFTHVMLTKGAQKVFSIDVGYGQLDYSLRKDPRVVNLEKTNARYLTFETIGERVDFMAVDVSFISVKKVLGALKAFMKETTELVILVKPQFEAGKEVVKKKGVIKDPGVHTAVLRDLVGFLESSGILIKAVTYSPITGPKGNIEFLVYGACVEGKPGPHTIDLKEVVALAHKNLMDRGGAHEI